MPKVVKPDSWQFGFLQGREKVAIEHIGLVNWIPCVICKNQVFSLP
jgi:hypothetical protein